MKLVLQDLWDEAGVILLRGQTGKERPKGRDLLKSDQSTATTWSAARTTLQSDTRATLLLRA